MRLLSMLLLGACLAAPLAAQAAPLSAPKLDASASSSIEDVAGRCGRHAHYVPGHRNHRGQFVRGHCVRDHR